MLKTCSAPNCDRPSDAIGYCKAHYNRVRRGRPLDEPIRKVVGTPRGAPMRFVTEIALKHTGDDCLIWPFSRANRGYGVVTIDGKQTPASRHVCRLAHGDPPEESYYATHSCNAGHEGCVNPHHLSWKTCLGNAQDKIDAGHSLRGELNPSCVLTTDQVREILRLKGTIGARKIGLRYGVCESTVLNIHRGHKWGWLKDTP